MRRVLRNMALTLLLAGCSFVVTVDDSSYHVSVQPLPGIPDSTLASTPTPTATLTPQPTVAPTSTPSATSPPVSSPTPTQEVALTPLPTPVPGEPKACLLKTFGSAINERTAPSASAPKTATSPIPAGSIVKVFEFASVEGYLFARNEFGWFVTRQGTTWWVYGVSGATELCQDVPGWPPGLAPPADLVRGSPGVWVGPGANRDELIAFGVQIKAAGYQPAAVVYGEPATAEVLLARGWQVALRAASVPDCPDMALLPETSAARFAAQVIAAVGTRAQVVVLANECAWPGAQYVAAWVKAAGHAAAAMGVRALVPVVWNPGAPPLEWVPALAPAYRSGPIALLWGMNVYPARSGVGLAARDGFTAWTTWRWELYRAALAGVPMAITEFARGEGAEPPDVQDIRAWWQQVREAVVWATAWYAAAPLGHWAAANLRGRLGELAGALQ